MRRAIQIILDFLLWRTKWHILHLRFRRTQNLCRKISSVSWCLIFVHKLRKRVKRFHVAVEQSLIAFRFFGSSHLRSRKHSTTRNDRTSVKYLLELWFYFLVIEFLGTLTENILGTLALLADSWFLRKALNTTIVEKISTKFLVVLQLRIKEVDNMCALLGIVHTESKLLYGVSSCCCDKIHTNISIVAQIISSINTDTHVERASSKRFLVAWITEMTEKDGLQLIAVSVAVHLLIADKLSYLRFFLGVKLINFASGLCLRFADDRLVYQKGKNCAYLLLDGSLAGIHLGHQKCHDVINRSRECWLIYI